ncbi:MAG: hypothetical protein GY869_32875, partial [Planctomycetes bacterium]|nr:hypothetical protein [Planctomycetota bacterium]
NIQFLSLAAKQVEANAVKMGDDRIKPTKGITMNFDVILQKQQDNGYIARPVLWPDSSAHGTTEQEALKRVRALIHDLSGRTRLVRVNVEAPENEVDNPWLAKAGAFADDPTWDDFKRSMADYRRSLDAEQVERT